MSRRPRPLRVGLTGGFGSGKSTVAGFFKKLGARVVDSDRLAHEVFKKGHPMFPGVRALFPETKGVLTRSRAARAVFSDPKRRRALESLVHPYVFQRIREEIARAKAPVIVLEVPLLFESGFDRACDVTVTVRSPERMVLGRMRRRGFSEKEVRDRLRAQMALSEKVRRADYTVDNSKSPGKTRGQVKILWEKFKRSHPKKMREFEIKKGA